MLHTAHYRPSLHDHQADHQARNPGSHARFVEAKREEWQAYIGKVTEWELERYLSVY